MVNENWIDVKAYPPATLQPSPAPFSPSPKPAECTPTSIMVLVEYERSDWETTNVGPVDHLIYGFWLSKDGEDCWENGELKVDLKDSSGRIIKTVTKYFNEANIEVGSHSKSFMVYLSGSRPREPTLHSELLITPLTINMGSGISNSTGHTWLLGGGLWRCGYGFKEVIGWLDSWFYGV